MKGDFVWYTDDTKEVYPGRVIDTKKGVFIVEICLNKKKSSGNELDRVEAKEHQLKIRVLGL